MKLKRRKSAQREKIFEIIKNTTSHPTASNIFDEAKKHITKVSLGNVYRNIKILVEEGRVSSLNFGNGVEHFDAIVSRHYHFVCENCNKIIDFDVPILGDIEKTAQKISNHAIKGHVINFYGICEDCKKKMKLVK
jgi:Fur family transcriptional regulator, peroxide stress response regulator